MESNWLYDVFGVCGFMLYMVSYALLQLGVIRGHGWVYPALNMAAAAAVLVSLGLGFNLGVALIQCSYILLSIVGIVRIWTVRKRALSLEVA